MRLYLRRLFRPSWRLIVNNGASYSDHWTLGSAYREADTLHQDVPRVIVRAP